MQGQLYIIFLSLLQPFQTFNYWQAAEKTLQFYDAQRNGYLPNDRTTCWRYHSFLQDKGENCEDLTGGWMDAGDFIKYNLPMSAATTMLALGGMYYKEHYLKAQLFDKLLYTIKSPLNYFMKCYINENLIYGQCGTGEVDHAYMSTPEDSQTPRKCYKLTNTQPGTEVAAGMSAALTASYFLFKDTQPEYAANLIDYAKKLYTFGNTYRGKYSDVIYDAFQFYRSYSGYWDELAEAGALLYMATQDSTYLANAEQAYINSNGDQIWGQSWDEKRFSASLLLYDITKKSKYMIAINNCLNDWINNKPKVDNKLSWLTEWGSLRYAANAVFLGLITYDKFSTDENFTVKDQFLSWAKQQVDYILGDNSLQMSFIVGFGNKFPQQPHHKSSACPDVPHQCTWADFHNDAPNPHLLDGGMVGGPNFDGTYDDIRNNYVNTEVACDINGGVTGALIRFFGTEQDESVVQPVNRTCDNLPKDYIGHSASNFDQFEDWLNGKVESPFEGCSFTENKNFDVVNQNVEPDTAPQPEPQPEPQPDPQPNDTCNDIHTECLINLHGWKMCEESWWNSQCQKTCCECGCDAAVCVNYNDDSFCNDVQSTGQCASEWYQYVCQKSCNTCSTHNPCAHCFSNQANDQPSDNSSNNTSNDTTQNQTDSSCVDNLSSCTTEIQHWDMCTDPYFKQNCQRSCCECTCSQELIQCKDFNSNCQQYKEWGMCQTDEWAKYVCQQTCNSCNKSACYSKCA